MDEYELHFTKLKNIGDSPMHFRFFDDNEREDTDDYVIGRAVHRGVLLGIAPTAWSGRRQGKEYKAAVAANNGELLLTATMRDDAIRMIDAVLSSHEAMRILHYAPNRETERKWARRGIHCAGRVDAWGRETLVELKTDKNPAPRAFQWRGKILGYREQLAWYDVGLGTVPDPFEPKWRASFAIAVGKKAPWAVSIHRASPLALQQANTRVDEWLDTYQACLKSGKWPGWDETIHDWDADIERYDEDED
jgi:hypothetical protein